MSDSKRNGFLAKLLGPRKASCCGVRVVEVVDEERMAGQEESEQSKSCCAASVAPTLSPANVWHRHLEVAGKCRGQNVPTSLRRTVYPCGQQSSCCEPIGLTEGEIDAYRVALGEAGGREVEAIDMGDESRMAEFQAVADLTRRYGLKSIPTVVVEGEIFSLGPLTPVDAVSDLLG